MSDIETWPQWTRRHYTDVVTMLSMSSLVLSIPGYGCLFMLFCAFPPFWPAILAYVVYIWFDQSSENGSAASRFSPWYRSSSVWANFAAYFPITLHKTVDLDPAWVNDIPSSSGGSSSSSDSDEDDVPSRSKHQHSTAWKLTFWWYYYLLSYLIPSMHDHVNQQSGLRPTGKRYIFGFHPHGIISMGAIGAIATDGAGWSTKMPGIPVSVLTLANQFVMPFYREMLLALGMASVSKRNCEALLSRNQSICIIVGGAQESLLARPGQLDLVLNKRKGFIKLALETPGQISLVPVLAFGENDIYEQVDNQRGTWLFKCQQAAKNVLGFTLPLLHARGVFNYDVGIMPYRRPIDVVVGEPILVDRYEPHPCPESVDHYHGLYVEKLEKVYNDNKQRFARVYNGKRAELRIVE